MQKTATPPTPGTSWRPWITSPNGHLEALQTCGISTTTPSAKNRSVSEIPSLLAERGDRIVLQIHDFAEDGRPKNFERLDGCDTLYPVAGHVHYAFINSRDRALLTRSGLPTPNCHLLPNAVTPPDRPEVEATETTGATVLYPVRGIRRKNLGELCLLSALAPDGTRFAVSLAPDNPQWRPNFEQWKQFATEHNLPATLGVVGHHEPAPGVDPTFENWLAYSTHLATTSIAEGFGLSFLEPIGLGLPLFGRDLPEITRDFKDCGINLGSLYERLPVPLEWIDEAGLKAALRQALSSSYASYRRQATEEAFTQAWKSLVRDDTVDFGNLPEAVQMGIIEKALASPEALEAKEWLDSALATNRAESTVEAIAPFSPAAYQLNLSSLHQTVAGAEVTKVAYHDRDSVLDQFLKPERFHFLRA